MRGLAMRCVRFTFLALGLVLGAAACGDLDDATTVHDLRVLAVRAEPAGFLVPLDDPGSIAQTKATLTALVVNPKGEAATLSFTGEACPDYIDTITAASGQTTKLCPGPDVTGKLPPPLDQLLATTTLPPGTEGPTASSAIQYEPKVTFGLEPAQIAAFFNDPLANPTGIESIDRSTAFNRDFSFDALVNLNFTLGDETASVIKRVVYWPALASLPGTECAAPQIPNQNPDIATIDFYRERVEGNPTTPYADVIPTVSLAAKDKLYVQPTYAPASAEHYLLRVVDSATGQTKTECRHELLTFSFYATAGTFSPDQRQSELLPFLTGDVHLDSQWNPPKPEELPADGKVTIWIVVREERAGSSWMSRTFNVTP